MMRASNARSRLGWFDRVQTTLPSGGGGRVRLRCRLREFRAEKSLRDLAAEIGVNHGRLSEIENGQRLPPDELIPTLEQAYGRPLSDWYDWRGPLLVVEMDDQEPPPHGGGGS
jgi:DNA-binding XRE family transcriptional regulator